MDSNDNVGIKDRSMVWNTDLMEAMELENLLINAAITMHGAEQRTESRGAHAREDFTERNDKEWIRHTLGYFDHAASGKVSKPLIITRRTCLLTLRSRLNTPLSFCLFKRSLAGSLFCVLSIKNICRLSLRVT